jgi:outer membrane protein OmpA-like peptidoglycan-associated protein
MLEHRPRSASPPANIRLGCGLLLALAGCGASLPTAPRFVSLRRAIALVTEDGAYGCAPRELALARANLQFAQIELDQGDTARAEQHLEEAQEQVGAAQVLSPRQRCQKSTQALPVLPSTMSKDSDGDGVPDDVDRCPDQPEDRDGNLDADGCSEVDADSDGIPDPRDACPLASEDIDQFQDDDGCPDPDNDGDGIDDGRDACPDNAGPIERVGCPLKDYPGITVTERELRLASAISFEANTATIRSVSFALLDTVAEVLRDQPRMTIEIGAHTDSQGDDADNLLGSQVRAESVRKYLVGRGVDPARLTARGYGETRPIESNSTSQGRAINRRIELVRTDRVQ